MDGMDECQFAANVWRVVVWMCFVAILGQFYVIEGSWKDWAGDFSTVYLCRVFFIQTINFFVVLE